MNKKFIKHDLIPVITLSFIVFLIYSISSRYSFLGDFDDSGYVTNNPYLQFNISNIKYWFTHACVGCYLPLTMLSYMLDYSIWSFNSFGYHLQNIFWHTVTIITIYKCFRLFDIKPWISFLICLIFAAHPQRVESVVWISERKDLLCSAFYFLSIYFYISRTINNLNKASSFPILSFIFFILAILSKPMAVSLPIILLIYEWHRIVVSNQFSAFSKNRHLINNNTYLLKRLYPYFIILAIFIPISIITQSNAGAIQENNSILSFNRLFSATYNIYWYFFQTFLCTENSPMFHPHVISSNLLIQFFTFYSTVFFVLLFCYKKKSRLFFAIIIPIILCYLVSLLPVSGLIKIGPTDHADRYSYIPSVFIWFGLGILLKYYESNNLIKKKIPHLLSRRLISILIISYILVLFYLNIRYQQFWHSKFTLFSYASTYYHVNALVLVSLADIELNNKNYKKVLNLINDLNNDIRWKPLADFYKIAILINSRKKVQQEDIIKLKKNFEKNLNRKVFQIKYPVIIQMLQVNISP